MKPIHDQSTLSNIDKIINLLTYNPFLLGILLRFILMIALPVLFDDGILIPGFKYTDIDYDVFNDAAELIENLKSPYERHTYRYTPFLAAVLAMGGTKRRWWFGRGIFCLADALCGYIIVLLRREQKTEENSKRKEVLVDALWWLYNPLAINICTRGSAESFIVLLPVLLTIYIATSSSCSKIPIWIRGLVCGILHGTSIHAKLYPVIYTVSFMTYFSTQSSDRYWRTNLSRHLFVPKHLFNLSFLWIKRLLQPSPILFLLSSVITFSIFTLSSLHIYGPDAVSQGLLYHFDRLDHRHNYSIYWYWIYLARARHTTSSPATLFLLKQASFLPQSIFLLLLSFGLAPYDLHTTLFLQTFVFVLQNKVITGQYFTWYVCLLPLCSKNFLWNKLWLELSGVGVAVVLWLSLAYGLEMKGMDLYLGVWIGSLVFFVMNVILVRGMIREYRGKEEISGGRAVDKKQD